MRRLGVVTLVAIAALTLSGLGAPASGGEESEERFRVLVFSKTTGFRHGSIPDGIAAIEQLGAEHGFGVDATEDSGWFTDENLARYQAVVWLSTDGNGILDAEQQAAFRRYVQAGGGYVGIHAASATHYDWPWYGELVGAYFQRHPAIQEATVRVEAKSHPSNRHMSDTWEWTDEWYDFDRNPRGRVTVLLNVDEGSYNGGGMGFDHPVAWYHFFDGGRSWYTSLGHNGWHFSEPVFVQHLLGGIEWAAAAVPIVVAAATPHHGVLPLTVEFSSAGSRSLAAGLALSYAWDLDGDGQVDSTAANPSFTYTEAGDYTVRLTVTDEEGKTAVASVEVFAGNTEPEVGIDAPVHGGLFEWGDTVAFDVTAFDAEDGEVDCERVVVRASLVHGDHAHLVEEATGCQGEVELASDGEHAAADDVVYEVEASYTDDGAPGVSPLTGRDTVVLQPRTKQAEHFDDAEGVSVGTDDDAAGGRQVTGIGPGDWIAFTPVNLLDIDAVTYRVGSPLVGVGGEIELRVGTPDGEVVSSARVNPRVGALGFTEVTADVDDPGGTHTLYVVFNGPLGASSSDLDNRMFTLDQIRFDGQGVSS